MPLFAQQSILRRKGKSAALLAVLAIGVAMVILITTLSSNAEHVLTTRVRDVLSSDVIIEGKGMEIFSADQVVMDDVQNVKGVKTASRRIAVNGLSSHGPGWSNTTAAIVYGIDLENDEKVCKLKDYSSGYSSFSQGSISGFYTIMVGKEFLENSELSIYTDGEVLSQNRIKLTAGKYREEGGEFIPIVLDCVIAGSFNSQLPWMDARAMFISIEAARQLMDYSPLLPVANQILVKLNDGVEADTAKSRLQKLEFLDKDAHLDDASTVPRVRTFQEVADKFFDPVFSAIRPIEYMVIGVSLFGTGAKIAHSVGVSMRERKVELATMRAMGISDKSIFSNYLTEHTLLGTMGGIAGVILATTIGLVMTSTDYKLWSLPLKELNLLPSALLAGSLILLAGAISLVMSYYMVHLALKRPIVEGLAAD